MDQCHKTWAFLIFGGLLMSGSCFANPINIFPTDPLLIMLQAVVICLCVDFTVLVMGYALVRCFWCLKTLAFLKYLIFVVIAGFMINGIVVIFGNYFQLNSQASGAGMIFMSFVFLSVCNWVMSRSFFALGIYKAGVIGALMGVFTNPYVFSAVLG